ncbi:TonB-dependent receptor [Bacteroides heparinolyticus]|uniref:TonB-dependent receptor n=1 Tax=Prevotella heparinolytica TaxID=28113 RepID=UPI00359FE1E6
MKDGMKDCVRNGMENIMKDGMRHCIAATVALLFLVASAATATELENDSSIHVKKDLQEVVVVGTKANRHNLSPAAVSVMDAHQLQTRQVVNLNDLSGLLPNFYMPEYGSRQTTPISIRGVMSKVKGTAVGFYVDGIPHFETSAFDANMLDLRAIEVFRGPQGTLYGRNTIGGVINLYTPTPFEYQGTKVRLGYGNYNHTLAQFSNYTRMGNSFGTHVSGYYQHNGGYFENTFLGRKADKMNLGGGKLGFYWNPAARWNLRLISSLDYTNQGGYPYAVYDAAKQEAGNVDYNRECGYKRIISTNGLTAHYQGDGFTLNSQTSFQHIHDNQQLDQDFTRQDNFFVTNGVTQNVWSEELTLKSDNDSRLQWIAGVFGFAQRAVQDQSTDYIMKKYLEAARYDISTQGLAVFAQGSYNLWRGLSATLGLRLDYEHSTIDYNREKTDHTDGKQTHLKDFTSSLNHTRLIPKIGVQYKFDNRNTAFANITQGYKAGAFNQTFQKDEERSYAPEYNWNYEVGVKTSTRNGKVSGELTLFYIDWRHQQISRTVPGVGNIISNAGHSESKGVEASLQLRPAGGWLVQANYGYTYARFLDYKKNEKTDYSHNMIPMVPRHTVALNAEYSICPRRILDRLTFSANLTGTGKLYWIEDNEQVQDFYMLLGGKIIARKGIFSLELWGKNLTNTDYLSYYFRSSAKYAQKGVPLTFGINAAIEL